MDKEEEEQGEDLGLDGQPSPPPSVAAPGVVGAAVATAAVAAVVVAVVVNLAPQWRRRRQGGFFSLAAGVDDDVRLLTFGRHRCSTSDSERKRNQDFNVCLTNTDCERTLL